MNQFEKYVDKLVTEELMREAEMPSMETIDTGNGMETVYRVAFSDQLDSVFSFGYDRIYTGTKGGNMYGPGVYCTFNLRDSIENVKTKPEYGNCIMSMRLVGGFKNFIIFDEYLAKKTYGRNWQIEDQLATIMGLDNNTLNSVVRNLRSERYDGQRNSFYNGRTAPAAHSLWLNFKQSLFKDYGVRGLIYKGNRDGHCALVYDFKSLVPYGVSFDYGKTFKKRLTNDLYNHIRDHADVSFQFGGKYKEIFQSVKGYTLVGDGNGKLNIVSNRTEKPISPYWFDDVQGQINPFNGIFGFTFGGYNFKGTIKSPDGGQTEGCVLDPFNQPFCDFSDLKELTGAMRENGAKDIEEFIEMQDDDMMDESINRIVDACVERILSEARTVDSEGVVTIDNFDDVKKMLLNPDSSDDVWFVQIIKRHKDNMNQYFAHNACEYIAHYLIHNAEELEAKRNEIISVCRATNSRAYMHPNKRSLVKLTDYANNVLRPRFERFKNRRMMGHEIEIAAGQPKDWPDRKLCFLDIDSNDEKVYNKVMQILDSNGITPIWQYRSLNNGWHILLPDKDQARNIDFSVIDNGNKFGRFSTVGLEIDRPILLYASLKPNGYTLQQNVQKHKMRKYNRKGA